MRRRKLNKREIDKENVQGVVKIQIEIDRERHKDEKVVLGLLKLEIGRAKWTLGGQNAGNETRVQLESLIDQESEAHALEMQAEQNEEIVAIVGKMKVQSEHSYLKIKTRETRISE